MYMYGIPVGEEQRLRCFFSAFLYNKKLRFLLYKKPLAGCALFVL